MLTWHYMGTMWYGTTKSLMGPLKCTSLKLKQSYLWVVALAAKGLVYADLWHGL